MTTFHKLEPLVQTGGSFCCSIRPVKLIFAGGYRDWAGNGRTKTKSFRLELVVPALCYSIRRGALAAVLQFGGADFRRHAILLLVSASLGHHRSDHHRDRLFRD